MGDEELLGDVLVVHLHQHALVEAHDRTFAPPLGLEQLLREVLLQIEDPERVVVDHNVDEIDPRREDSVPPTDLHDQPLPEVATRLRLLNGEAPHPPKLVVAQLDAKRPLIGRQVVEIITLDAHLGGDRLVVAKNRRRHQIALLLNDHPALPRTVVHALENLCEFRGEVDLEDLELGRDGEGLGRVDDLLGARHRNAELDRREIDHLLGAFPGRQPVARSSDQADGDPEGEDTQADLHVLRGCLRGHGLHFAILFGIPAA